MPDPYERHSRSRWEWGSPGSRSQERAAAAQDDPAKTRTPGKKDPDLCKGQHWKSGHTPALRVRIPYFRKSKVYCYWGLPYWDDDADAAWYCSHEEYCSGCGKILLTRISNAQCPQYHEITKTEKASVEREREERAVRRASWKKRPRKVITGPQGYRKKRND